MDEQNNDLQTLKQRIDALHAQIENRDFFRKNQKPTSENNIKSDSDLDPDQDLDPDLDRGRDMRMGLNAGTELIGGVFAGGALGWFLDHMFETKPLFLCIGLILGMISAFYNIYCLTMKIPRFGRFMPLPPASKKGTSKKRD